MTIEERLAQLEGRRTPAQVIIDWLREAQQFDCQAAYARSLIETPPAEVPIAWILRKRPQFGAPRD